jgi:hypothetical protein
MSEQTKIPNGVRIVAEQAGLGRVLKLFPEAVRAAAERGLRPLGEPAGGMSPIASPASIFDPTRFENDE